MSCVPEPSASSRSPSRHSRSTARLVGDGVHLDLGVDNGPRLHRRPRDSAVRKILGEDAIVPAEIAGVFEIDRDLDDVAEVRAFFGQDAPQALDGPASLLLDVADAHVAAFVFRHLAGDEYVVAGPDRGMERQVRILLPDGVDVRLFVVAHGSPYVKTAASMMSTPRWRSIR